METAFQRDQDPRDAPLPSDADEVSTLAAELIRFDTSNFGGGRANGEREAAEYVAAFLSSLGIESRLLEKEPRRSNLIARWPGSEPTLPALVLNAHLDVVPAMAEEWSVDPFGGVIRDGLLWGRGAVDMKNMAAMILAAVARLVRAGQGPRRDIILAFFADEEDNSHLGSAWLVEEHPELFAGADCAIGEVGGFSVDLDGHPVFLVQTGEKGILWLRLRAVGRSSHGSQINRDESALLTLAAAVVRIGTQEWPLGLTPTTSAMLEHFREVLGVDITVSPSDLVAASGPAAAFIEPGLRTVSNPSMFTAGYKENVVPGEAEAVVDVRVLPGHRDDVLAQIAELAGAGVEIEILDEVPALETDFDCELVRAMGASVRRFRPEATLAPYLLPGGTDNPMLARLGIRGFGFAPLLLPTDFDFPSMFHGVDERVPLSALRFGVDVLEDLLRHY